MKRLPYPFPGMNPYLEHPVLWEPAHVRLAIEIADQMQPLLVPRYVASVAQRVYVEGPRERKPDVWIEKASATPVRATATAVHGDAPIIVEAPEIEIKERRVEFLDASEEMKVIAAIDLSRACRRCPKRIKTGRTSGSKRPAYVRSQRSRARPTARRKNHDCPRKSA